MKFHLFCLCLMATALNLPCAAQESTPDPDRDDAIPAASVNQEKRLLTDFELADSLAIDKKIIDILKKHLSVLNRPAEPVTPVELRLLRTSVRKEITDIVATEGYFSPSVTFQPHEKNGAGKVLIHIDLGPVTRVTSTRITFTGDAVPAELQQSMRATWGLPDGARFRDDDWVRSKNNLLESLTDKSYAAAKITNSEALVQDQQAELSIELDSGPVFCFGEIKMEGLNSYQPWLVQRYHPPQKGDTYSRETLLKFQRELQNSPYFSSVTVSVEPDPASADAVPVEVLLSERQKYDLGLGAGYSTNTGARGDVSFRDRNFLGDAYDLRSVIRIEQKRQIGYTDIYLPPQESGYLDSVGVLVDRSDISGLLTDASSFGAKRVITDKDIEHRMGLSYVYEESTVSGGNQTLAKALVASLGWTRREVDNVLDPRHGYIAQFDLGGAAKAVLSDQNFIRLYGKFQYWYSISPRDVLILRAESGYVIAPGSEGVPEDYLFRAGGTASVRGYSYQSLGVNQSNGVVGGRVMATGTTEYVHWTEGNWGVAVFVDEGDAADRISVLRMQRGLGTGLRYKTPAGPIAIDLAYGSEVQKFRLDFSIGIAF